MVKSVKGKRVYPKKITAKDIEDTLAEADELPEDIILQAVRLSDRAAERAAAREEEKELARQRKAQGGYSSNSRVPELSESEGA
jgi:hypothetical protein